MKRGTLPKREFTDPCVLIRNRHFQACRSHYSKKGVCLVVSSGEWANGELLDFGVFTPMREAD